MRVSHTIINKLKKRPLKQCFIYVVCGVKIMKVETTEEVLNEIADRFMIYGACKSEDPDGCDSESHFCCRVGFTAHYQDRFDNAHAEEVENELFKKFNRWVERWRN